MVEEFRIGDNDLEKLFPFYFRMETKLQIVKAGKGLLKLYPGLVGNNFTDAFRFIRPSFSIKNTYDSIAEYTNQVIIIQLQLKNQKLLIRGQMLIIQEQILFVGSPWMAKVEDLEKYNLLVTDFAVHDPVTEMLQVLKVRQLAFEDVQKHHDGLVKANKEISDLAKFPSENPHPILRISFSGTIK
ncbi:MAG: hypothetical protein JKY48_12750 [Flavobacteriales bacterium]|nr:hypothetical protein [Flavobacteriales bacterium]